MGVDLKNLIYVRPKRYQSALIDSSNHAKLLLISKVKQLSIAYVLVEAVKEYVEKHWENTQIELEKAAVSEGYPTVDSYANSLLEEVKNA